MELEPPQVQQVIPRVCYKGQVVKSDQCLKKQLGDIIDLTWQEQKAIMNVSPSQNIQFKYQKKEQEELFKGISFMHSPTCPLLNEQLQKNGEKNMAPCVVVLLQNKHNKKILATQRHPWMSFGGQWVLPGGHLEPGEDIVKGGLRQCQEEVGLPLETVQPSEDMKMMVWESVSVDQKKGWIKRSAFVLFIKVQVEHFEVKPQQKEVGGWQWRDFQKGGRPWGGGWAQGHLAYLSWLINEK